MNRDRFKGAPWMSDKELTVLIGGAGGIGSWTALLLKRAGFEIGIYDDDTIESHNLGGQLFRKSDIGTPKVDAVEDVIKQFCGEEITTFNERVVEDSMTNGLVVMAFDNMKARKVMYESWKKEFGNNPIALLIDGRLIAEQIQVFCIRGNSADMTTYEKEHLFDDEEVEDAACTFKQTSHFAAGIAFLITTFLTNHVANVLEKNEGRQIPFFTQYYGPLNMFE